ncbi:hypothetical protein TTHERM_00326790 (macronuclear) [Tetrahymena thermophila SB210]|uniref:Uncharacterized protein n=1 Tax=Tetrahymena thermophila (strain SB210) TaxID=312017 RepID=I7MAV0_TETTS|nr:hypothetical protein TTHERM_00326790 [Tetrahymena thermophila SB210]EAS06197.2 hypothetical protein TTHERM_00326790 [Tetrahymena thermophila SB210]|eukprot:XP_001026442.2 hypothetical protein TTHERM_00326790 [Tetrahymena thermophila SB210]
MSRRKVGGVIKKAIEKEEKEPVKKAPKKKPSKAVVQQEQIMLNIENANTTQHIKDLCDQFEPPACKKCPNRNADRICVNAECGHNNYLELICGKCHFQKHSECKEKPELDVEEFFIKLGTFLNETKFNSSFGEQGINTEKLQEAFAQIDLYNQKLDEIELVIKKEILTYKTPEETHNSIANSITKAISEPTFENIQNELENIKSYVLFEDNNFKSNGISEKAKYLRDQVKAISEENKLLRQTINSSFIGGRSIDISDLKIEEGLSQNYRTQKKLKWSYKNGSINIQSQAKSYQQQVHLDFEIDPYKKYTLRWTVNSFNNNYHFVGLFRKDQVKTNYMYSGTSGYIFKRFYNQSPTQDCSEVVKGIDFGQSVQNGSQYEMRFSISDNILQFCTYPDYENVVSKFDYVSFDKDTEYVITFNMYNNMNISIDSLEESYFFPSY